LQEAESRLNTSPTNPENPEGDGFGTKKETRIEKETGKERRV
jgi:hypothetical protein